MNSCKVVNKYLISAYKVYEINVTVSLNDMISDNPICVLILFYKQMKSRHIRNRVIAIFMTIHTCNYDC